MKLLLEFLSLFLESNDRFRANIKAMERLLANEAMGHDDLMAEFWLRMIRNQHQTGVDRHAEFRQFFKDMWKAKALHETDVTGLAGMGAEGVAFELADGTIFKIGDLGHGDVPKGRSSKYREKHERRLAGAPRPNDLDIIDVGRGHVQMEKLIPFVQWVKKFNRPTASLLRSLFDELFETFQRLQFERGSSVMGNDMMNYYVPVTDAEVAVLMGVARRAPPKLNRAAIALARAFINEIGDAGGDLTIGNLGVRVDADGACTFVFYDF